MDDSMKKSLEKIKADPKAYFFDNSIEEDTSMFLPRNRAEKRKQKAKQRRKGTKFGGAAKEYK